MKLSVSAEALPGGQVKCHVECDGQEVTVFFTGAEVFIEVPEPARVPA